MKGDAMDNTFGSRLRFARKKWDLTQTELAKKAGVNIATVQRAEWGTFDPRLSTVQKLANALHIHEQWLVRGDIPMVPLWGMSVEDQHQGQNGPGSEGLPGYVIVGPGPWFRDDDGEWQVDGTGERKERR